MIKALNLRYKLSYAEKLFFTYQTGKDEKFGNLYTLLYPFHKGVKTTN